MDSVIRYTGSTGDRLLSPLIWQKCPISQIQSGQVDGIFEFDDFVKYQTTASGTVNAHGMPTFDGSAAVRGGAPATTAANRGGALELFTTNDNEEAALERGGSVSAPYIISNTAGIDRKFWFECRIKNSLVDNVGEWFVGLAAPGTLIANFHNDNGTDYSDTSFIGFTQHEDDGNSIDFTYQAIGNAFSNVATNIGVPTADAYNKLGFVYDPDAPNARKIKIYVDSVEQSTYVTTTLIDTATFPETEALGLGIAIQASSADDRTVSLDWWAAAQLT